jgi:hypothetical protein
MESNAMPTIGSTAAMELSKPAIPEPKPIPTAIYQSIFECTTTSMAKPNEI